MTATLRLADDRADDGPRRATELSPADLELGTLSDGRRRRHDSPSIASVRRGGIVSGV